MKISTGNVEMTGTRKYKSSKKDVYAYQREKTDGLSVYQNLLGSKGGLPTGSYSVNGTAATDQSALSRIYNETDSKVRYLTLRYLIQQLFCKRIGGDYSSTMESLASDYLNNNTVTVCTMTHFTEYSEEETTTFNACGKVTTEDGREIEFGISVGMSRSFYEAYSQESSWIQSPSLDPLVINLDGSTAQVSDQKFYFDLNQDGEDEYISYLSGGSGFLAMDKNADGEINDGSELFGTSSGDGFADLMLYDEDENGWIDENDDIFSQLKVWCFDDDGNGELYDLAEVGVGAICLNRVATKFSVNELETNDNNATIQETGLFLFENGKAGTVQHLDMAL